MAAEDGYEEANMENQVPQDPAGNTEASGSQESRPSVGATLFATTRLLTKAHQTKRQKSAQALFKKRSKSSTVSQEGVEDSLTVNTDAPLRGYSSISQKGEDLDAESTEVPEWMKVLTMLQEKKIINSFLVFVPAGIIVQYMGCSETVIFIVNFLAMVPLASLLGDFTEEVAAHTSQMIGGLIQATLGNAVEVVVAIQALYANQIRVVQASLLGSVFSNMLLVLGCCFFFGGLRNKNQSFNATSAVANMSLLLLSSLALVLPTPLSHATDEEDILRVSRFSGVFLLVMYAQLLVFQFGSHADLFVDAGEESKNMSLTTSLVGLLVVTALVSILSDFLVSSIDGFTEQANLSKTFVGLILLPIIGNAVEHITAVTVAVKDKMELAMGVAVGSATQVSMFVVPVTVLSGWAMGRGMTLKFPPEEIILYVLSIIIVATGVSNGTSNWLQGSLLITTYVLVAVACWFEKIDDGEFSGEGGA